MRDLFEIIGGSVLGRDHRLAGRNNQDAYLWQSDKSAIVAVVCDGCGSAKNSEVGAKIGAGLLVGAIFEAISEYQHQILSDSRPDWRELLESARQNVLAQIRILARSMTGNFIDTVCDYFLFTTLGAVITQKETVIFSIGDGIYALNGGMLRMGPFSFNAPPYLSYGLFSYPLKGIDQYQLKFRIEAVCGIKDLDTLLLATDGAEEFDEIAQKRMPGKKELVGEIKQFWEEDKYFKNPDMARRKLAMVNNESLRLDWDQRDVKKEPGLLRDDTTLIAIRRRK